MVTEHPRMRRLPKVFVVVVGLSLIATLGVGCKQGLNERCEQDSDCASGLKCSKSIGGPINPGVCESNTGTPDTGVPQDVDAGTDASDDAPMSVDADATDDAPLSTDATMSDTPSDTPSTSDAPADTPSTSDAPADTSATSDAASAD
jgi:hypothetical protein